MKAEFSLVKGVAIWLSSAILSAAVQGVVGSVYLCLPTGSFKPFWFALGLFWFGVIFAVESLAVGAVLTAAGTLWFRAKLTYVSWFAATSLLIANISWIIVTSIGDHPAICRL